MRTKLALLAALVLGFLAAIGVRSYVEQKETEFKGRAKRVAIAVARENLNVGDELRETSLKRLEVETGAVTDMHILYDQRQTWLGRKLARKVKADNAVMKDYFIAPETSRVDTRKVDIGMRAITIGTDQIAGVAGLITPGSRVDIVGTFRIPGRGPDSATTVKTMVVVTNVEVIAVDNRTDLTIPIRGVGRRAQMARGYSSVTLHVTPLEASVLIFAQGAGKLSFALRNVAEGYDPREIQDITFPELDAFLGEIARKRASMSRQPGGVPKTP
jgi:pilus assembly protein CpaB